MVNDLHPIGGFMTPWTFGLRLRTHYIDGELTSKKLQVYQRRQRGSAAGAVSGASSTFLLCSGCPQLFRGRRVPGDQSLAYASRRSARLRPSAARDLQPPLHGRRRVSDGRVHHDGRLLRRAAV